MNFDNSQGLRYEAEECRQCIMSGKLQADEWTHEVSMRVGRILSKARAAIGSKVGL